MSTSRVFTTIVGGNVNNYIFLKIRILMHLSLYVYLIDWHNLFKVTNMIQTIIATIPIVVYISILHFHN